MPEDRPIEPNADIWPEMLVIADASEKALALAFLQAIKSYKNKIDKNELIKALKSKDIKEINKLFPDLTIPGFNKVGKKIIDDMSKKIYETYNFSVIGLDIKDLELHKFIDKYVADLVVQIDDNTRLAIKDMIREGWDKEINPNQLAENIKNSGIGLDTNRQKSLENYRQALYKDKELKDSFSDFNSFEKEIQRRCIKKYDQLLLARGHTIARTEAMNFVNEGSRQMYEEAAKNNSILRDGYELCWIVTPDDRLCDKCRAMRNERCPFDGTFKNGLRRPTLHVKCRCCLVCIRKTSNGLQ